MGKTPVLDSLGRAPDSASPRQDGCGPNVRVSSASTATLPEALEAQDVADVPDSVDALWSLVVAGLRRSLGARAFDNWLGRVRFHAYCAEDRAVVLALPSAFTANWVATNFGERLTLAWRQHIPTLDTVRIVVDAADPLGDGVAILPAGSLGTGPVRNGPVAVSLEQASPTKDIPQDQGAGPARVGFGENRFDFAHFVLGEANRLAANAARAMAEAVVAPFNPLYIQGTTGQGKTHLLHATAAAFADLRPEASVLLLSAERFMIDFVHAVRARDTFAFKARLRSVDLLLIDDFQFIAGKETTQEELLYTIDALTMGHARLVIAADRSPQALDGVDARLLSRLTQGLVADIQPADRTLRRAILAAKAADRAVAVGADVLDLLADRISASVRELEGALNRLVAYASLTGRPITLEFAEEVLAEVFRASRRRVSIEEIQKQVASHFQMRQAELLSPRRARAVARPRQIAMYLAKQLTPRSFPEIGRSFGGRDHTTVMHAVRQIEKLRASDSEIDGHIHALIRTLRA